MITVQEYQALCLEISNQSKNLKNLADNVATVADLLKKSLQNNRAYEIFSRAYYVGAITGLQISPTGPATKRFWKGSLARRIKVFFAGGVIGFDGTSTLSVADFETIIAGTTVELFYNGERVFSGTLFDLMECRAPSADSQIWAYANAASAAGSGVGYVIAGGELDILFDQAEIKTPEDFTVTTFWRVGIYG